MSAKPVSNWLFVLSTSHAHINTKHGVEQWAETGFARQWPSARTETSVHCKSLVWTGLLFTKHNTVRTVMAKICLDKWTDCWNDQKSKCNVFPSFATSHLVILSWISKKNEFLYFQREECKRKTERQNVAMGKTKCQTQWMCTKWQIDVQTVNETESEGMGPPRETAGLCPAGSQRLGGRGEAACTDKKIQTHTQILSHTHSDTHQDAQGHPASRRSS